MTWKSNYISFKGCGTLALPKSLLAKNDFHYISSDRCIECLKCHWSTTSLELVSYVTIECPEHILKVPIPGRTVGGVVGLTGGYIPGAVGTGGQEGAIGGSAGGAVQGASGGLGSGVSSGLSVGASPLASGSALGASRGTFNGAVGGLLGGAAADASSSSGRSNLRYNESHAQSNGQSERRILSDRPTSTGTTHMNHPRPPPSQAMPEVPSISRLTSTNDQGLGARRSYSVAQVQFTDPVNRRRTFEEGGWPTSSPVSVDALVDAGFYYIGPADRVRCAYCKKKIHQWEEGDDVAYEHKRISPFCRFAQNL